MSGRRIVGGAAVVVALFVGGTQLASAGQGKVTICHHPGTGSEKTIEVAERAVAAHLRHGDVPGECEGTIPTTTSPTSVPPTTAATTTVPPTTTTVSAP